MTSTELLFLADGYGSICYHIKSGEFPHEDEASGWAFANLSRISFQDR